MRKQAFFAIVLSAISVAAVGLYWNIDRSSGNTLTEAYYQGVRNGLAEANLPTSNNVAAINAGTDSLSNFMYYRSGVQLSTSNKASLRSAEASSRDAGKTVDAAKLTQIITDIAVERIPNLSSTEISNITESLRGFSAPDLPLSFQRARGRVKLRSSGLGQILASDFSSELTDLRNGGIQSKIAQNLVYVSIANEVDSKVETIRTADPQFFGGTKSEMTPMQALLVAYAVIADDSLLGNSGELAQRMQLAHQVGSNSGQRTYPSPSGHRAFGDNGYLHSSPTSVILNDASVMRLLTLIQERAE